MTDVAITQILKSSAPGHFDSVAQNLSKLGAKLGNLPQLQQEEQASRGILPKASAPSNPVAVELKEKLLEYQRKAFPSNSKKAVQARVWVLPGDSSTAFTICTCADKTDAQNLQTGFWKATWTVSSSSSSADIQGSVELHTYTHEEGNTQLQLTKEFSKTTVKPKAAEGTKDKPTLVGGLLYQIVEWEHEILSLLKALPELSNDSLKKIRRVLPITKTKMNWEVEAQRGVKHLKKTAKR